MPEPTAAPTGLAFFIRTRTRGFASRHPGLVWSRAVGAKSASARLSANGASRYSAWGAAEAEPQDLARTRRRTPRCAFRRNKASKSRPCLAAGNVACLFALRRCSTSSSPFQIAPMAITGNKKSGESRRFRSGGWKCRLPGRSDMSESLCWTPFRKPENHPARGDLTTPRDLLTLSKG